MKNYFFPLFIFMSIIFVFSCSTSNNREAENKKENNEKSLLNETKLPKLYITTRTVTGLEENRKEVAETEIVDKNYFEVTLSELAEKPRYVAMKKLINPQSMEDFKYKFFHITDENGEAFEFENSTDFLNFMSDRNYVLFGQTKNRYGGEYTFQKKNK